MFVLEIYAAVRHFVFIEGGAYARDDRPWGGTDPPAVAYLYPPDPKAERPIAHLAGFNGVLQVDGYAGP